MKAADTIDTETKHSENDDDDDEKLGKSKEN